MNRDIISVPISELTKHNAEELYDLLTVAIKELETAKRVREWLESAIALKYEQILQAKRIRVGKDTGIIHIEVEGFKLSNDVPRKVEWDQKGLAEIVTKIMVNGGKLDDYVEVNYSVPETKYNGWSSSIRSIFEPARTVKLGKATYKLSKIETHLISEGWL